MTRGSGKAEQWRQRESGGGSQGKAGVAESMQEGQVAFMQSLENHGMMFYCILNIIENHQKLYTEADHFFFVGLLF